MGCWLSKIETSRVTLQHFRLERVLGKGGFGKVYCAVKKYGTDKGTMFAMKQLLKAGAFRNLTTENMLFNELHLLKKIYNQEQHPHIANIHYAFHDTEFCYIVLDLALGGDLYYQTRKQASGHFNEDSTKFYGAQIVMAISFLHDLGILHRDIKPENILLTASGYIKLTDFGISAVLDKDGVCSLRSGTKGFMAPEVAAGSHKQASDYFSIGVTLYFLATGEKPFEKYPPIQWQSGGNQTPNMVDCLTKLMEPKPSKRIASLEEFEGCAWLSGFDWERLATMEIIPEFIPDISNANCDSGHHDAQDALFGVQKKTPKLSLEQGA